MPTSLIILNRMPAHHLGNPLSLSTLLCDYKSTHNRCAICANAKYLAHLAHQTPFDPIYQMCHISYFLQHATVKSQIRHGTNGCVIWIYYFFYSSFSLISPSISPSNPNTLLSLTPILSSQTPSLTALPRRRRR